MSTTSPDLTAISSWTADDYAQLTPEIIQSMTNTQVATMQYPSQVPLTAVSAFTPEQTASITVNIFPSSAWVNALSIPALQALSTSQVYHITRPQLVGVDNAHLAALTAAQVAGTNKLDALSSAQFGLLNLTAFSAARIAGLSNTEYAGISAAQIASLSAVQVAAITSPGLLSSEAVSALSADQMAALTAKFSTLSPAQIAAFSLRQYQGLTATQMAAFTPDQLQALAHPEWLSPGLINQLSVQQFSAMTGDQFAALSPAVLLHLDTQHLAAWPGDVTTLTQDELLAVGPRLSAAQYAALTDGQRSILATSDSTALNLISSLSDANLKSIMQGVESGTGSLFSFDAIESVLKGLDNSLAGGNVSAAQYADLQNYVTDIGQTEGTNSSVYSVVNSLVNTGNGASVDWVNSDGTHSRIGSLTAGSSAATFGELIATWMDGTDHPVGSSTNYTDGRPLFANGTPTINDIKQGKIGDCGLLAAMQAVVTASPDYIKSMFHQNSNGTYSVRLFNNGVADWVTVDNQTYAEGEGVSQSSWAAILERAVENFSSSFQNYSNSYGALNGSDSANLKAITGDSDTGYWANSRTQSEWDNAVYTPLKAAMLAGEPAELSSWIDTNDDTHFESFHAFAITGYDAATDKFVITNPWGAYATNGTFEATVDQLWQNGTFNTTVDIINSSNASGIVGQLVTAMASTSVPAAGSASSAVAPAAQQSAQLVAAHV